MGGIMEKEYEIPSVDVVQIDVDIITSSDWELPKVDW